MLPFIFFALYEKDGQPAEKILGHVIKSRFLRDKVRPYRTSNLYAAIQQEIKEKEELQICNSSTKKAAEPKRLTKNGKVLRRSSLRRGKEEAGLAEEKDKKAKKVRKSAQQTIP